MSAKNDEFGNESSNSHRFLRFSDMKARDVYGSPERKQGFRSPLHYAMEPEVPRGFSNVKLSLGFQDNFEITSDFSFSRKASQLEGRESTPLFSMKAASQSFKENSCPQNSLSNFASKLIRKT